MYHILFPHDSKFRFHCVFCKDGAGPSSIFPLANEDIYAKLFNGDTTEAR